MSNSNDNLTDVRDIDYSQRLKEIFAAIPPERQEEIAEQNRRAEASELHKRKDRAVAWTKKLDHRYRSVRFDNFRVTAPKQQQVLDVMQKLSDEACPTKNILLMGNTGSGKTHLAVSMLHVVCRNFVSCDFVSGRGFASEMANAARFQTDETAESVIRGYSRPQVLLLDDPAPPTGLVGNQGWDLQELLDKRLDKCTIVTLNAADPNEAALMLSGPAWSRLCDGAVKLLCNWTDHRQKRGEI